MKKTILIVFAVWLSVLSVAAATVRVQARLDSVTLLMGRITTLKVTVDEPVTVKGYFPLLRQVQQNGIVPVCGDSVELRLPSAIDTVVSGNSRKITLDIPVQSFDSGYYRLPELAYVVGNDTSLSGSVALKVIPVPVKADTPINGYAGVADPEDPSIFDYIPDWIIDFWWLILAIAALILLCIYLVHRYRQQGSILPQKPKPTPYEVATKSLAELKEKKLWEQGMEKEYFTELTDILREYLYGRFGINAMEMTSRQILAALSRNENTRDKKQYFRKILDMADFVKFAKVRPLPADNVESYDNAVRFVEETKPVVSAETGTDTEKSSNKPADNIKVGGNTEAKSDLAQSDKVGKEEKGNV